MFRPGTKCCKNTLINDLHHIKVKETQVRNKFGMNVIAIIKSPFYGILSIWTYIYNKDAIVSFPHILLSNLSLTSSCTNYDANYCLIIWIRKYNNCLTILHAGQTLVYHKIPKISLLCLYVLIKSLSVSWWVWWSQIINGTEISLCQWRMMTSHKLNRYPRELYWSLCVINVKLYILYSCTFWKINNGKL